MIAPDDKEIGGIFTKFMKQVDLILLLYNIISKDEILLLILGMVSLLGVHEIREHLNADAREKELINFIDKWFSKLQEKYGEIEYTENDDVNYREARKYIEQASECCSTYFVPFSWRDKPGELEAEEEFIEYGNSLHERIKEGKLLWRWIVRIHNKKQFNDLIADIKDLLTDFGIIERGYNKLRVVPPICNYPLLNFTVMKVRGMEVAVFGISTGGKIEEGAIIRHERVAKSLGRFFDWMWEKSIPIIDDGIIHYDNLIEIGTSVYGDNSREDVKRAIDKLMSSDRNAQIPP